MDLIAGGNFTMGSDDDYEEEGPAHRVAVGDVWIDRHLVTVREFARFVGETGYVTVAERPLEPADFPGADPAALVPGSLVFRATPGPVPLDDYRHWWDYVPGACWRCPEGTHSDVRDRQRHPVTHVAYEDAMSFAQWAGKRLPTEVEWEHAARGGLEGRRFAWGDEDHNTAALKANTWQGDFPWRNTGARGYRGTSPVATFAPNGYGLYDMVGNVWEWTSDAFVPGHEVTVKACCGGVVPRTQAAGQMVVKGGSYLCSPDYCLRYRPAARQPQTPDSSSTHIGFRCARDA